ncbi:DUF2637 domain-containing protein [Streptomyces sp. RY43-2]|uniref:DUF2637 domain-containing protein n=1 Tax=Streptomyces macrolidinus TaxID=2952607 RepID=A0ABT0ZAC3_9ACTN|nr:DUF2637 domain-containing protein [Streptomyces macrolidinus]MCN9240709.1 DUF2637 domain-containing protein [Streptomyces macrolidinus]
MSHFAPIPARINGWDRAAVVALGGAGCALSYDALQQMATAIHVRGLLTFVFPLVIDGFIAYGVRALLVLRTAPLAARCYVWTLFGTATAASIWANALHAVRLNQQQHDGAGLRLGDLTVGVLSTLAPLALAGAVHLYILIARRATEAGPSGHPESVRTDRVTGDRPDTYPTRGGGGPVPVTVGHRAELPSPDTGRPAVTKGPDTSATHTSDTPSGQQEKLVEPEPEPEHGGRDADQGGHPALRHRPVTRPEPAKRPDTTSVAAREISPTARPDTGARKPTPVTDEQLLVIARQAVTEAGDLTRKVVADAIRGHGHGLGNDRLTVLMQHLRKEAEQAPDTPDTQTG